MASIHSLPFELLELILRLLLYDTVPIYEPSDYLDDDRTRIGRYFAGKTAFAAVSLVCRLWRPAGQSLLYETVLISGHWIRRHDIQSWLTEHQVIAGYVKTLVLDASLTGRFLMEIAAGVRWALDQCLLRLPSLRNARIYGGGALVDFGGLTPDPECNAMSGVPSVKALTWQVYPRWDNDRCLSAALQQLSQSLVYLEVHDWRMAPTDAPLEEKLFPVHLRLMPRLRTLRLIRGMPTMNEITSLITSSREGPESRRIGLRDLSLQQVSTLSADKIERLITPKNFDLQLSSLEVTLHPIFEDILSRSLARRLIGLSSRLTHFSFCSPLLDLPVLSGPHLQTVEFGVLCNADGNAGGTLPELLTAEARRARRTAGLSLIRSVSLAVQEHDFLTIGSIAPLDQVSYMNHLLHAGCETQLQVRCRLVKPISARLRDQYDRFLSVFEDDDG